MFVCFCFRAKFRHGLHDKFLGALFSIEATTAGEIWNKVLACHSSFANVDLKPWTKDDLSDAEKDALYEAWQAKSPLLDEVIKTFRDPLDTGRQGVVVAIDSIKIRIEKSGDFLYQKTTYFSKLSGNYDN